MDIATTATLLTLVASSTRFSLARTDTSTDSAFLVHMKKMRDSLIHTDINDFSSIIDKTHLFHCTRIVGKVVESEKGNDFTFGCRRRRARRHGMTESAPCNHSTLERKHS